MPAKNMEFQFLIGRLQTEAIRLQVDDADVSIPHR